jgi:hypothetical protein
LEGYSVSRVWVLGSIALATCETSAAAAPATERDRTYVEYKLYDAMNEVLRDGSASNPNMACEAAKAVVVRFDSHDFTDAEIAECFGYVAEMQADTAAACGWWERAAAQYDREGRRQGRDRGLQSTFLLQERSRSKCRAAGSAAAARQ